mmetsp:Transcript_16721/g.34452  ORF Transcript_16721/g.34452 Transcript_16721/m.34452 type:complete len:95 (+) Transcript_16721:453-737(+)
MHGQVVVSACTIPMASNNSQGGGWYRNRNRIGIGIAPYSPNLGRKKKRYNSATTAAPLSPSTILVTIATANDALIRVKITRNGNRIVAANRPIG